MIAINQPDAIIYPLFVMIMMLVPSMVVILLPDALQNLENAMITTLVLKTLVTSLKVVNSQKLIVMITISALKIAVVQ
jgi:hypothetical protein